MRKITTIALFVLTGLVCMVNAQDYSSVIKEYFAKKTSTSKTNSTIYKEWEINNIDPSTSLKATVINIQQKINGVPVMYSDAVLTVRDGAVITEKDNFLPLSAAMRPNNSEPSLNKDAAISLTKSKYIINDKNIDGHLVYYPVNDQLVLSWRLIYHSGDLEKMTIVDANTGSVIRDEVTTISCTFHHDEVDHGSEDVNHFTSNIETTDSVAEQKKAATTASYRVFALPVEAPTFGPRSLINDPWIAISSPVGWHNDGDNSYSTTRGNNVYAYDDSSGTNTPGNSPLSPNLTFDYPLNINENAKNYKDASVTNLFYVNNMIHDVFYSFGFTETARNFQNSNFGKGGSGGDYVRAEAQDGARLDNANFSSGYEGSSIVFPKMQMYLWSPKSIQNLSITSPAVGTNQNITSKLASFGPSLASSPITGSLQLTQPADGCTAITNGSTITGNIAFIERGNCNFVAKVKFAQDAGAKAVVIYNPLESSTFGPMGGTDPTITIPSILIKKNDADYLKTLMASQTVTIDLEDDKTKYNYIDGSLDNGIVLHEYGHGITNRMTGTGYGCLDRDLSAEQMGEGWSDYFALMLTYQPGATAQVARGVGTFAGGESTTGAGIRPARYSTDFNINDFTYGDTNSMSYKDDNNITKIDVHSVGFVYATILWDMTWKMIERYGYAPDVINNKTSGNAKALQLVVDALKLQGCNPGFIEGRNAIIQADLLANGGQNECLIWGAFTKRGVGVNASAGNKKLITDQVQDLTYPAKCAAELSTTNASLDKSKLTIFPNPAKDQFYIKNGSVKEKLLVTIYNMSGGIVSKTYVKDGEPVNVRNLTKGIYLVNIEGLNFKTNEKIIINN